MLTLAKIDIGTETTILGGPELLARIRMSIILGLRTPSKDLQDLVFRAKGGKERRNRAIVCTHASVKVSNQRC